MHFRKIDLGLVVSMVLLAMQLSAADTNGMVETDTRLPAGPKGAPPWGFHPAASRNPNLPNVLLVGDSVLNAYRTTVIKELQGTANVDMWLNPYYQASPGLNEQAKAVLTTNGPYAVIHFNMGLHGWQKGRIPEGQYDPLMRKFVRTIVDNARGAQLIWASTTPVRSKQHPGELDPEINGTIMAHNAMAAKIMEENKIPIDDLYSLMTNHLSLGTAEGVHWTPEGARMEGLAVANAIKPYLGATGNK